MTENETQPVELSVVLPCLNEADTLATCIGKAQQSFEACGIVGEVVVSDNGSNDGCPEIAERCGARVVHVEQRGYGSALMGGIAAARGRFILMGDADDSYDFLEIPRFVESLRQGNELVQGCRLPSGGGHVMPGAMPFLHRWLGNPLLSALARGMFRVRVHDAYCGMRGFTKELYDRLDQRCTGMEFATEMIIKSSLHGARIAEVPITLHPDGRKHHGPHLRTFRDGWRTLRFFLLSSPRWLFLVPGAVLLCFGLVGYALALSRFQIGGATLGPHTLLVASLAVLMGFQSILFAILSKTFAVSVGLLPPDPGLDRFYHIATLERGLLIGAVAFLVGLCLIGRVAWHWHAAGYGPLDYELTMRWVIPGVTLGALATQLVLSGFFVSMLGMNRR
ncbi:MAG: glycosyltransferase family 2 protein [Deltaproteobacteria bacterium]|nr:glycosyltransferase family 2 protein [Deltaproteobacteria bacterium]MBW2383032.1 glycosyltransferase family 2 protein [Deltaproteobacteria bacterium]